MVLQFRMTTLASHNLTICANTKKRSLNLLVSVGSVLSDGACGHSIIFTILLKTLALYSVRLRDGNQSHDVLPFRYIVGCAPHPFISAKIAYHPKVLIGTYQVLSKNITPCKTINYATSCRK
jgi:hypothetical protein